MKLKLLVLAAFLTVTAVLLVSCGNTATATPQPPPTLTSAQLNEAYEAALSSGDLAAFIDVLADDFVFTQVPGPDGTEMLTVTGRSAFMVWLAGQIENKTKITSTGLVYEDNKSTGKFSLTADNFRAIGIDTLTGSLETTARGGKLTRLDTVLDAVSLEMLDLNQSQGGNYILERWQRHGRCKHQCVGSGL